MCLLNTALVSNVYVSDKFTNILDYPPSFSLVLSCNSSWTDFADWGLSKLIFYIHLFNLCLLNLTDIVVLNYDILLRTSN